MPENLGAPGGGVAEPGLFESAADFGAALTSLKQRSGISLRQLSASSGLGFSTINGYCRGRHLPQAGVGEQFRSLLDALGVTAERDQEAWLVSADRLRRTTVAESAANPYPGLRPYDVGEDRFFYGRARLVAELAAMATGGAGDQAAQAPVVVVGPSGAGKSSLLRAGLIPALSGDWTPVLLTPGKSPMDELAGALATVTTERADDTLGHEPEGEPGPLSGLLGAQLAPPRLLVLVDQLEEIFGPHVDEAERDQFLTCVMSLAATSEPAGRRAVVLGLRADFYDRALHLPQLADLLREAQFLIPPMNADELRQVITGPARAVGKGVDSAVVERVVGEVAPREAGRNTAAHEPGALPLLAHALHEAFALSSGAKTLALEHYARTGGVVAAIARTAEAAYEQLSEPQQHLARSLLLSMVHVGDTTADTRRRLSLDEVTAARPDIDLDDMAEVLDSFIAHRLLTVDTDSVEISHEALLVHWPRLHRWIDEARDHIRIHHRVADGTQLWLAHDRDPGELARGARLDAMRTLLNDDGDPGRVLLNVDERDFVTASLRAQRSRHRRLRLLALAMTLLAVLTTAFAALFAISRQQAQDARDEALSRQMAVTARQLAADDPNAAVQLAIAGYRRAPTTDARSAMMDLAAGGFPTRHPSAADGNPFAAASPSAGRFAVHYADTSVVRLYRVAGASLKPAGTVELRDHRPHTEQPHPIALSPDGKVLVTHDGTNRLALFDVADPGRPARLGTITGSPRTHALTIAPDGDELAAAGPAAAVHRWNISDPAAPDELDRVSTPGNAHSVSYGPGGVLAAGDDDATVGLWRLGKRPEQLAEISAGQGQVQTVAFSPDGRTLTAGTALGRSVSVWDVTDHTRPEQLEIAEPQFDSWVNEATFSPDGSLLLAASSQSVVRIWDTTSWETVTDLPHPNFVGWVGFSGRNVATTFTDDGTVWSWNLRTAVPARMPGRAWRTTFASDTGQLAVFAEDAAAVWSDRETGVRHDPDQLVADRGDEQSIGDGDISADGSLLVHSYVGGKVAVFDLARPGRPTRLAEFTGDTADVVQSLDVSPNGRWVATGGDDTVVRLHDLSDPRHPRLVAELDEPKATVLGVRWQPQGDLLTVAGADGTVGVYDVSDPREAHRLAVLDAFDSEAHLAEFSPDGTLLAAGGLDGVIRIWDTSDPAHPQPLGDPITGPVNTVPKLAFHPDGDMLAATDSKGAVWLYDISDPRHPTRHATLEPGTGQMNSLAFHPGGERLASTSVPGVVRLWHLDEDKLIDRTCATVGEPITRQEWHTHLPDTDYRPPC